MANFDLAAFSVSKFDSIIARGLSNGQGTRGSQVCIEAAICEVLDLPHGDDPGCVAAAVRAFKIVLNDSSWSSPQARAAGLRSLGLAQLGSLGVVDDQEFARRMAEKTIRILIPKLFRAVFPNDKRCMAAADRCETEGTVGAAKVAAAAPAPALAASAAETWAAEAAAMAARAARAAAWAARAARAAAWAAEAHSDEYLFLSASLALDTLRELNSPGIQLLQEVA